MSLFDPPCDLVREAGLGALCPLYRGANRGQGTGLKPPYPTAAVPPAALPPALHTPELPPGLPDLPVLSAGDSSLLFFSFTSIAEPPTRPLTVLNTKRVTDNIREGRALSVRLGGLVLRVCRECP